jgi:hypothetical protein
MIFDVYDIYWVLSCDVPLGAPLPGFIYATGQEFYKSSSRIQIRAFLLRLQVIFESLYLSTSLMSQTRYTNQRVPNGHTHVNRQLARASWTNGHVVLLGNPGSEASWSRLSIWSRYIINYADAVPNCSFVLINNKQLASKRGLVNLNIVTREGGLVSRR